MATASGPLANDGGESRQAATDTARDVGLKVGLEIHQQLDTTKLFCACPSRLDEGTDLVFERALRPTASELGEVDPAALAEARRRLRFEYQASKATSCLVEMDEEPPHPMTRDAVDVSLTVALLLGMRPVDEIHVMRKIVIDGSNTSGFQRTSLAALDGHVETSAGRVGIATLCIEEDAARKVGESEGRIVYRLDRLGIPLVEIATTPDIRTPAAARECAEAIGLALRSTGRVKRGLGTIRQDLNVSIRGGARVEIKGVQDLRIIAPAVEWEIRRQQHLLHVRDELALRGVKDAAAAADPVDVTDAFKATTSKVVKPTLDKGGVVLGLRLPGFAGLLKSADGKPESPRLGRELADHAKIRAGVKGIFHSDELPAYGITQEEVARTRTLLGATGAADAFVLVAAPREVAQSALEAVRDRARRALDGVPEEVRDVLDDGTSRYLRPLPGGARMYPETDVPPIRVRPDDVARLRANLPEMIPAKIERFRREYALGEDEARVIVRGPHADLFESLAKAGSAREAARVLVHVLPQVRAEAGEVPEEALAEAFAKLRAGAFAKEAMPEVLKEVAKGAAVDAALARLGLAGGGLDVVAEVDRVLDERADFVRERGLAAAKPLMGALMAKLRGRVSGEELSRILEERIRARLS